MLNPEQSAILAKLVYTARNERRVRAAFMDAGLKANVIAARSLNGSTGGHIIRKESVCAMAASFRHNNRNHLVLVFRGTRFKKIHDLMTNADTGMGVSETGQRVHRGFNEVFESMREDILRLVSSHATHPHVHCIGHSLGGAVATLTADWIKTQFPSRHVNLYTFGAPRVGLGLFASRFTQKLSAYCQHRVYNEADPIPVIPIFPFMQTPLPGHSYQLPAGGFALLKAHDMDNYIAAVKHKSWKKLENHAKPLERAEVIQQWLRSTRPWSLVDAKSARWMEQAISMVISKAIDKGVVAVNELLFAGSTVIDTLTRIVKKGIDTERLKGEKKLWFSLLLQKIAQGVGIVIGEEISKISIKMIRFILDVMLQRLGVVVRKSLEQLSY